MFLFLRFLKPSHLTAYPGFSNTGTHHREHRFVVNAGIRVKFVPQDFMGREQRRLDNGAFLSDSKDGGSLFLCRDSLALVLVFIFIFLPMFTAATLYTIKKRADPQRHRERECGLCDPTCDHIQGPCTKTESNADADANGNPNTHDDTEPDNEVWRQNRVTVFLRCTLWGNFRNILNEPNRCTRGKQTWDIFGVPRRKT